MDLELWSVFFEGEEYKVPAIYFEMDPHAHIWYIQQEVAKRKAEKLLFNKCDCGARHTNFNNKHLSWCSIKKIA